MNIFINGVSYSVPPADSLNASVAHALRLFLSDDQQQTTFAVALNSEFVGRDFYSTTPIKQGDSIDVLFPIQGG